MEANAEPPQAGNPAAEKRGRLLLLRKNTPARADEGFNAEPGGPFPQGFGRERGEEFRPPCGITAAITRGKTIQCFRMGEIESAAACDEELAPDGGLLLEKVDPAPRLRRDLGGPKPGGTATDDGDGDMPFRPL